MKKILFICAANKQRSKTAEDYFSTKYPKIFFYSAGTNLKICNKEGTNPLSEQLLKDADIIFVMEKKHRTQIEEQAHKKYYDKIIVLNIPDIYKYYQKELIEILQTKVASYIDKIYRETVFIRSHNSNKP